MIHMHIIFFVFFINFFQSPSIFNLSILLLAKRPWCDGFDCCSNESIVWVGFLEYNGIILFSYFDVCALPWIFTGNRNCPLATWFKTSFSFVDQRNWPVCRKFVIAFSASPANSLIVLGEVSIVVPLCILLRCCCCAWSGGATSFPLANYY